jgi:hypothetical protein
MRSIAIDLTEATRDVVEKFLDGLCGPRTGGTGHWWSYRWYYPSQQQPVLCIAAGDYSNYDADELRELEAVVGAKPTFQVSIDVSGTADGTKELRELCETLLFRFDGRAFDDYSEHPWTLGEIKSGAKVDGLGFFDFNAYHQRSKRGDAG